ncbi:oligopeptidase B [Arcanobacterium pluranimalium]|uniref:S9 family peptidase n=1 Tax=Arcanobacterium pluranimalium TaxID=108028 RepID=UPI001956C0D0|nr:S9 family peptidase [Arcanobacterium pluranimalium]MBM7824402.1 oligopeptidase B [Arcanobacterium pluranimalium]
MSEVQTYPAYPAYPAYPVPDRQPQRRVFHGDEFIDDYEWLRDEENPKVMEHISQENAHYEECTKHLAGLRKTIVDEIARRTQEDDVSPAVLQGDYWYWTRTWEGKSYPGLFRTRVVDPNMRPNPQEITDTTVVYDGNILAAGKEFFSIGSTAIAPDGKLAALAIDDSGDETFTLRIHDIDTGAVVDDSLKDVAYGLVWSADSRHIFYMRTDEAWRSFQVWRHELGADPTLDQLIYQEDDEKFNVGIARSNDGCWLSVLAGSTTQSEQRLLSLHDVDAEMIVVCPRTENLEYAAEPAGDHLLITHNSNNPDFEISRAPIATTTPEQWESVFSAADGEHINSVSAYRDFAVIQMRSGGSQQLRLMKRLGDDWQKPQVIPGAELASIELSADANWETTSILFSVESLIRPVTYQNYDVVSGEISIVKVTNVPGYDAGAYVEYREWATAQDGTKIPLTIAHRADLDRAGHNPGLIYGYGSYEISMEPWFSTAHLPILDRGVVYVVAHIRGGGEMGRKWYEQGKMLHKRNTFTDFIDAAQHVVDSGLVDGERIAAEGGSAGGLLMGAVANLAPWRFRVIHAAVPFVDALTTILKPELPLTVGEWEEWGNPIESQEVYEYMKSYSPYENIQAVEYPAILASTSINDIRVSFVEPTKWVAKLRATVTNDFGARPILQRTELVAGHGGGSGRYKRWEDRAHQLAFMFDQLGITE